MFLCTSFLSVFGWVCELPWRNKQTNAVLFLLHIHMLLRIGVLQADDCVPPPDSLPPSLDSSGAEQRPQGCDTVERKAGRSQCEAWPPCSQIFACLLWTFACSLSPTPDSGTNLSLMHWWIPLLWPPVSVIRLLLWPVNQLGHCLVTLLWVSVCLSLRSIFWTLNSWLNKTLLEADRVLHYWTLGYLIINLYFAFSWVLICLSIVVSTPLTQS